MLELSQDLYSSKHLELKADSLRASTKLRHLSCVYYLKEHCPSEVAMKFRIAMTAEVAPSDVSRQLFGDVGKQGVVDVARVPGNWLLHK